ncbi:MAG: hypothetical protein QI199_06605 [Candidatus Korarchaeota archaeon]|nr:hypothetical protein [Candidatus Korarchaeota archaeon]
MKLYHLGISKGTLPPRVLLVGSRRRVSLISEIIKGRLMEEGRQLIAAGTYNGKEVAAVDTGMGPSSASIIVREVIEAMNREGILIRAGTCGSLQPHVEVGHLVVSKAVIADEQVSKRIVGDLPLMSHEDVVKALETAAEELGYERGRNLHTGVTHTKDALYEFEDPELSVDPESGRKRIEFLSKMGVLATEMEMSVILALTNWYNLRGGVLRAGGLFLVVSPFVSRGLTFTHPDQTDLVKIALAAVTSL